MNSNTRHKVLWFTNDARACLANNRRVLKPHTAKHAAFVAAGGERQGGRYADGAYTRRPGAFGRLTEGAIPRNVMAISHTCAGQRRYKALAREAGLPQHGAPFPEALAAFLIQFLTDVGQLVVDPMAGSLTVPAVCEALERPWFAVEQAWEYLAGGGLRLRDRGAAVEWGQWFGEARPHNGLVHTRLS